MKNMPRKNLRHEGFTLVEAAIVLTICALLIGGVFAGRYLIESAELKGAVNEYQEFTVAVGAFRDRYNAFPGDMKNATDFWGDNTAYCSDGNASNDGSTCNGDGNGKIGVPVAANKPGEMFLFWQHLALADFIKGQYTGIAGPGNFADAIIDVNSPASKYDGGGWTMRQQPTGGMPYEDYVLDYGNHFTLGADNGIYDTDAPLLQTQHALFIDGKFDDGKPAQGKIVSTWWNDACSKAVSGANSDTNYDAIYAVNNRGRQCTLIFRNIF